MHRAQCAYHRILLDRYMSGERGSIDQHRVIADLAVMTNVRVRHDEDMIANPGCASALIRSAINGHVFSNYVFVANLQTGGLAAVSNILGLDAECRERENPVVIADSGRTVNHD